MLATCVVVYPPVAKAAVLIPEPKLCLLEVPRSAISVHDVPSQDSVIPVIPGSVSPPIAKAAVYAPAPPANCLSVFNSAISVQLVPSNCSVLDGGPKNKAAVFVTPAEPDVDLAVLKSPDSVQLDPSHFSVLADLDASDTAYVRFYQSGGTAQTDTGYESGGTTFSGYLVA